MSDDETDQWGFPKDPAEQMQQVMLGLYDLIDEAVLAGFPDALIEELKQVRLKLLDEFERRHPRHGKGRAIWR